MKKYILLFIIGMLGIGPIYSQGTVDIMLENPRIINDGGSDYLYFDIYAVKTGVWGTGIAAEQTLSNSSFYMAWNYTDGSSSSLVSYNTTVFPSGEYSVTVGTTGPTGVEKLYVDVLATAASTFTWVTDEVYWLFTVRFATGGSSNASLVAWNLLDTDLTHYRFSTSGIVLTKTDYDSDCDIALNTKCWDGSAGGDWDNVNNWSPTGVPGSSDDVIYPFGSTTEMTVFNISDYGIVNNLRVNHHAQLTVPQNKGITASANLVLKGGTNVVLDGGTGQFLRSSALIVDGTINYLGYSDVEDGHIEVHRTLYYEDSDVDYYHHQVAAPVSGAILGDWDMIHTNSYAYEFQSSSQTWYNIYNPARSTPSGYGFILSLFGIAGNTTEDVVFTDNLVEGSISPSVESGAGNVTLIGNPYTAPISWSSMITSQTGIVDNVKIWDPSAGNYKQFIATPLSGNFSCEYIQPGQAFFVEAIDGTASQFDMTPADRSQNIRPYLKSTRQNSLRMYTEGGNKTSDETYIVFSDDPNVTSGYDMNHDGTEWPSTYGAIATELYTTASDNVHLGIDARPLSPDLMSVPVHFKAGVVGEYNLVADLESIETFSQGTEIFLEDIMHPEQAWIDMREFNSYTFEGSPEDDYDRFMIHFHIKDFGISELGDKPVNIYSERTDAIIMNNSGQIIREIQVFDIAGNLMTVKTGITEDVTRMYVSDNTGYYVIKVITDKAVYADKVLISK